MGLSSFHFIYFEENFKIYKQVRFSYNLYFELNNLFKIELKS